MIMFPFYRRTFLPVFFFFALTFSLPPLSSLRAEASPSLKRGTLWFDCSFKGSGAQDVCAQDRIAPDSSTTFLDLLKQIYPDLKPDGKASYWKKVRNELNGTFWGIENEEPAPGQAFSEIGPLSYLLITEPKQTRALILQMNNGLLSYLQAQPTLKLLDLIAVAQDKDIVISGEAGILPVRAGEFVFSINSYHHNSSESFNIYNLFLTTPNQLKMVYDGPFLYGFRLNDDCYLSQSLKPFSLLPTRHEGASDLLIKVAEEKICTTRNGKEKRTLQKNFEAPLTWNQAKQKYRGGSKNLFQLNKCRMEGKKGCS